MRIVNTQGVKNIAANGGAKAVVKGNLPKEGEVIEGKIIDSNRDMVDVLLSNGQKLRASLKGKHFFNIGDNVKFIVKSSDFTQLVLKGVSNNSIEDKLIKVLENAGERPNERNIDIVKNLFDEGMPVNKENVSKFVKLGIRFKGLTPKMLVSFQKLGIDFSRDNADFVSKLISGDKPFIKNLESFAKALINIDKPEEAIAQNQDKNKGELLNNKTENEQLAIKEESVLKGTKTDKPSEKELFAKQIKLFSEDAKKADVKLLEIKVSKAFKSKDLPLLFNKILGSDNGKNDRVGLKNILKEAFTKDVSLDEFAKEIISKGFSKKVVFKALREVFTKSKIEEKIYIKPEEFSKEEVKQSIKNTIKLAGKANSDGITDEVKAKAAKLTESIKVMDKLVQEYNFIHVPITVDEREKNAEVYVKKNKKKKGSDASLKALLRLDFVNMGHLDILVDKEVKNIRLRFYSKDKLEDVKENIFVLKKEFSKAGFYLTECEFINEVGQSNLQEFFSSEELGEEKPNVTFDMRA